MPVTVVAEGWSGSEDNINRNLGLHTQVYATIYKHKQDTQLSQRDRTAGCVIVFAKSRTLELGDNILRTL